MKKIVLLLLCVGLGACAQMLPARSKPLGNQRYQLESSGNMFAKQETLVGQIEKKARKLCPNGFEYENETGVNWHSTPVLQNNVLVPVPYQAMQRVIRCREAAVASEGKAS